MRLERQFYERDAREVSKDLLGKVLVHVVDGKVLKGKIVETEAYIGDIDKACHAYNGKRTPRVEPLYGKAGVAYIYLIYGMYHCFNIVTEKEGIAQAVLIRAVEPVEGIEEMCRLRFKKDFDSLKKSQIKNLTSGPGKLCIALNLTRENNKQDLCEGNLYVEHMDGKEEFKIVEDKRVGIDYAEEAKDFLWRYYIKDNPYVSVK